MCQKLVRSCCNRDGSLEFAAMHKTVGGQIVDISACVEERAHSGSGCGGSILGLAAAPFEKSTSEKSWSSDSFGIGPTTGLTALVNGYDVESHCAGVSAWETKALCGRVVASGRALSACVEGGPIGTGFLELDADAVYIDEICYNAAISACDKGHDWGFACLGLLGLGAGYEAEFSSSHNVATSSCEKIGFINSFSISPGLDADVVCADETSNNAAISACNEEYVSDAVFVGPLEFDAMHVIAGRISSGAAISACDRKKGVS